MRKSNPRLTVALVGLLAAAMFLLPIQAQMTPDYVIPGVRMLDAFKARAAAYLVLNDQLSLLSDFRQTFSVPPEDDVTLTISEDGTGVPPDVTPLVGACGVIVVVVAVVVWGVAIYLIYKICHKPSPPPTNSVPLLPQGPRGAVRVKYPPPAPRIQRKYQERALIKPAILQPSAAP